MSVDQIKRELLSLAEPTRAEHSAKFFKTGPGQYSEGDVFLGLTVPQQRIIAKSHRDLPTKDIEALLRSKEHEFRLTALIILVERFKRAAPDERRALHDLYMSNLKWVNNWDLVDSSAEWLAGEALGADGLPKLLEMAHSKNLWERRVAIVATFHFIKGGSHKETFAVAERLLGDKQDLIHKATGWMLREVGKRCGEDIEEDFLRKHHKGMPRTMLRYAIERFPETKRAIYMAK